MANVYDPSFDAGGDRPGFTYRRARLGRQAGARRGRPRLRTPAGWQQLEEGDTVAFPVGAQGAHQVANRSEQPARILMVSEMVGPEVVVYPDSGKVGVREEPPGSGREGLPRFFRSADRVDYWEGEQPPEIPS